MTTMNEEPIEVASIFREENLAARIEQNQSYMKRLLDEWVANPYFGLPSYYSPNERLFVTKHARLTQNLQSESEYIKANATTFAECGLYSFGMGATEDKTICFYCNVKLNSWEPDDCIFYEHARWSPNCKFLNLIMGRQFIIEVIKNEKLNDDPKKHAVEIYNKFKIEPVENSTSKYNCKVCYCHENNCAISPCGHMLCIQCATNINTCPICRSQIFDLIKIYNS